MCVLPAHTYVHSVVPVEVRRGCWITWNWSYRRLEAAIRVLGIEPSSLLFVFNY